MPLLLQEWHFFYFCFCMRQSISILLFLLAGIPLFAMRISLSSDKAYDRLYLYAYHASDYLLIDSVLVHDGSALLQSDTLLPEGIYFLTDTLGEARLEFLLAEDQKFKLKFASLEAVDFSILGAAETDAFQRYRYASLTAKNQQERDAITRRMLTEAEPGSFFELLLSALLPPPAVPASLGAQTMAAYDFKVAHFWDNYDLADARILRTPFFAPRFDYYLKRLILPREDKLREALLPLLARAEQSDAVLHFMVSHVWKMLASSGIMGIDNLGYELVTRYYLTGRMGTLSLQQQNTLEEYVLHTKDCRVGHKAKDIQLSSWQEGEGELSLYHMDAQCIVLLFWDPDCSHCQEAITFLRDVIAMKYKSSEVLIFAVNIQGDLALWRKVIMTEDLTDWYHGYQPYGEADFMLSYGIQSTPCIYLLDEEKTIVAKQVEIKYLDQMIANLLSKRTIY